MESDRQEKGDAKIHCMECGTGFTVEETSSCSGLKELGFQGAEVTEKVKQLEAKRKNPRSRRRSRRADSHNSDDEAEEEEDIDWIELEGQVLPSAKLTATKAAILNWRETAKDEKIIIYTQFLGLSRILDKMCASEGWGRVLFNGRVSLDAREKAINKFQNDPDCIIMICSLKAGGVGLNLNMASKVIILDLWFNSSIEAQAYCCAFRIGQERKVEVLRFVVKDSMDEHLIRMQERKDVEVTGAIGPDSLGKRATIAQLLGLFGDVVEEGQNEFILVEDDGLDGDDDDADVNVRERLPPRPF
jgi:SNF2 family DNA or RNA helicase